MVFIPNPTDNPPPSVFFEYEYPYTDGFGYQSIPDGTFPFGQNEWEGTANVGTLTWNVGSLIYDVDLGGGGANTPLNSNYTFTPTYKNLQITLYCEDTGEDVITEDGSFSDPTGGFTIAYNKLYTYTHDLTTLDEKYHCKRFRFKVKILSHQGTTYAEITSPEFFINTLNTPSAAQFQFAIQHVGSTYDRMTLYNFIGACRFENMEYISEAQEVIQKKFGNLNIDFKDYALEDDPQNGFTQIDVLMGFSDDAGVTWHDFGGGNEWIKVYDGVTLAYVIDSAIASYDPNPAGTTNAIRFQIIVNSSGRAFPLRFNSIVWSWYDSLTDIPQSNDNISSIMWNDRYLLTYTKAGDTINKYVLTYDEASGFQRYFKWYFPLGVSFLATYAGKMHYGCNDYVSNTMDFYSLLNLGDASGDPLYDVHYYFDDIDMGMPGIQKSWDTLTLLYDKIGQVSDELKVEIWIDGKYNGDLDIWQRKNTVRGEYFSLKHSALKKKGSAQINSNISYMVSSMGGDLDVPFGWGNKMQIRMFWGRPYNIPEFMSSYGVEILRELSIDALFFKDIYPEPALSLHEGNL
jgi:hypothetical protein